MKISAQSEFVPNPEILCHPNIPKPLHGINPRTIYGQEWWDAQRKKAYASTGFHCAACGVYGKDALFHPWLEAHEFYLFDYAKGRVVFDHLVPLCHACHNYIHDGRLELLASTGQIPQKKYDTIIAHGDAVVEKAKLTRKRNKRHTASKSADWKNWRMIVDGKEYGPSSDSYFDWLNGAWKKWRVA